MISVDPIAAFSDNYLWLLSRDGRAAVVDPGDAAPVQAALRARGLQLEAILITHHHGDHIGGIDALLAERRVPVYGPQAERGAIPQIDHPLAGGDRMRLDALELSFEIIAVPGHTLGHIAYYAAEPGLLFCGDTLFAAGCGRLFEGTPAQMHASLARLAALPPQTQVYCAHEYTLSNLAFAHAVEPARQEIVEEIERVKALRAQGRPSVPSTIARERQCNPFLRCDQAQVRRAAAEHAGRPPADEIAVFAAIRQWKDGFRAPAP